MGNSPRNLPYLVQKSDIPVQRPKFVKLNYKGKLISMPYNVYNDLINKHEGISVFQLSDDLQDT